MIVEEVFAGKDLLTRPMSPRNCQLLSIEILLTEAEFKICSKFPPIFD